MKILEGDIDREHTDDFWRQDKEYEDKVNCQCGEYIDEGDILCCYCTSDLIVKWETEFTDKEREYIVERLIY